MLSRVRLLSNIVRYNPLVHTGRYLEKLLIVNATEGLPNAAFRCFSIVSGVRANAKLFEDVTEPEFIAGYNDIEELKNASEWVQRIFRQKNAGQQTRRLTTKENIMNRYGDHELLLEAEVARRTAAMKTLLEHCQQFQQDKKAKVLFIWTIDQRKKALRKLQKISMERYFKIIKELDIPPLRNTQDRDIKYKSRKFKLNVPLTKKRELHEFELDRNY